MNRQRGEGRIEIDYYPGAWGPTIRIATQDKAGLLTLRRVLLEAAGSEGHRRDLLAVPNVQATGIEQLIMTTLPRGQEQPKTLRRLPAAGKTAFEWSLAPGSWELQAELIDGLLAEDLAGHQYLTQEGVDDALVEVTYKE